MPLRTSRGTNVESKTERKAARPQNARMERKTVEEKKNDAPNKRPQGLELFLQALEHDKDTLVPSASPPSEKAIEFWKTWQKQYSKRFADAVSSQLQYVPFSEFLIALKESADKFEKAVAGEPFVLVLPDEKCKSSMWVAELLIHHRLISKPVDVVATFKEAHQLYPDVQHYLMVDDGMYSGLQLSATIMKQARESGKTSETLPSILVIVPFATEHAIKMLTSEGVTVFVARVMPVLSSENTRAARLPDINMERKPIVYFDHKIPDEFSTYEAIVRQFVPACIWSRSCVTPPYKSSWSCANNWRNPQKKL